MVHHDLLQTLEIQDIGKDVWPIVRYRLAGLDDVRKDHIVAAILCSQELGTLNAQLSQAT